MSDRDLSGLEPTIQAMARAWEDWTVSGDPEDGDGTLAILLQAVLFEGQLVRASELEDMREWASSSENPAFDVGWAAGLKRGKASAEAEVERLRAVEKAARGVVEAHWSSVGGWSVAERLSLRRLRAALHSEEEEWHG